MVKIGIVGYGNLGRAAIENLKNFPDLELIAVFSRRPKEIECDFPVFPLSDAPLFKGKIDVMVLCGGSATDLPQQSPLLLKDFCTLDSFDTHAKIPEFFDTMDRVGKDSGTLGAISVGWDPGLFSLARALFCSVLPDGKDYTFWGEGVSQGHSDAIRRIEGVKKAIQYTVPKEGAVELVRSLSSPELSSREKHLRRCFVVADKADRKRIEKEIKTMPNYFADYDTEVSFITEEQFEQEHSKLPHGGFVMRTGSTDKTNKHLLEFKIKLDSNPQFTSSVLLCYVRALKRLFDEGRRGCVTVLDIPFSYLSGKSGEELRRELL